MNKIHVVEAETLKARAIKLKKEQDDALKKKQDDANKPTGAYVTISRNWATVYLSKRVIDMCGLGVGDNYMLGYSSEHNMIKIRVGEGDRRVRRTGVHGLSLAVMSLAKKHDIHHTVHPRDARGAIRYFATYDDGEIAVSLEEPCDF